MTRQSISRRTLLRGMGAALSLPLLEGMQVSRVLGAGATAAAPRRMAFFFVPNGVNLPEWTPKRGGYDYDLSWIL